MSTEVTTLVKALDLICWGDTAAEAQEGHRYLLALDAKARWAEDVARPALERETRCNCEGTTFRIKTGGHHPTCQSLNSKLVTALAAYPQPVEETP